MIGLFSGYRPPRQKMTQYDRVAAEINGTQWVMKNDKRAPWRWICDVPRDLFDFATDTTADIDFVRVQSNLSPKDKPNQQGMYCRFDWVNCRDALCVVETFRVSHASELFFDSLLTGSGRTSLRHSPHSRDGVARSPCGDRPII